MTQQETVADVAERIRVNAEGALGLGRALDSHVSRSLAMIAEDALRIAELSLSASRASVGEVVRGYQERVEDWMLACFGEPIASDPVERNHRFLEESLELVQSCGCTQDEAHKLVDYVYGRDIGEKSQEVGGVMVTLAALCRAQRIGMMAAGEKELARVWTKVDAIREKQKRKPSMSPLPGVYTERKHHPTPPPQPEEAEVVDEPIAWGSAEMFLASVDADERIFQVSNCESAPFTIPLYLIAPHASQAVGDKDGERYRWLRAEPVYKTDSEDEYMNDSRPAVTVWTTEPFDINVLYGDELDAAIDAAMLNGESGKV